MFFSNKHNLLYIASPKTGSTSIEEALKNLDPSGEQQKIKISHLEITGTDLDQGIIGHARARELKKALGDGNYNKLLKDIDYPFITSNNKQVIDLKHFIGDVYKLKDPSVKTLQFNTLLKVLFHKKILVKVVNKNLILPWFIDEFKPKHKPILLIRNPLDIIKSRANYGFKNMDTERNVNLSEFWNLSENNPIYREEDFLKSLNTNYEFYIAEWCLSLKPILNSDHYKKLVHLVDYEVFISKPKEVVASITSSFGVEFDLNSINFKKKSASTFRLNHSIKPHKYLPNYEERVQRIFGHFQLMDYYKSICKSR